MQRQARGIAHDFNNILTTIICHIELLLADPILPPPFAETIRMVLAEARRAATLSGQFSTFSRKRSGRLRVLNLSVFVGAMEEKIRLLAGSSVSCAISLDPSAGFVVADPDSLERAVIELACVIREGMQNGEELSIATRRLDAGAHALQAHPEADAVDHAVLILRSVRRHTDAPAPSLSPEAGRALAKLQRFVDQLGAYIDAESSPIHGATFRLFLPCFAAPGMGSDKGQGGLNAGPVTALEEAGR